MPLKKIDDLTDIERIRLYPDFLGERYLEGGDVQSHILDVLDNEFLTITENVEMVKLRAKLLAVENRRLPLQSQFLEWASDRL